MTFEELTKSLRDVDHKVKEERKDRNKHSARDRERERPREKHGEHRHHHRHRSSRKHSSDGDEADRHHRHKRPRHENGDGGERQKRRREELDAPRLQEEERGEDEEDEWVEKDSAPPAPAIDPLGPIQAKANPNLKRDSWMEMPSALDIDYTQRGARKASPPANRQQLATDMTLHIHKKELNPDLRALADGTGPQSASENIGTEPAQHKVDYTFGDAGSQWRMTKLKAVYTQATESGRGVDDIALERYGDLRAFDDAREEQTELERRDTYGEGYVGKEKPSGELFQERKMELGIRRSQEPHMEEREREDLPQGEVIQQDEARSNAAAPLDQTALNKLKATMLKAKLRNAPNAAQLESEYNTLAADSTTISNTNNVITLHPMENRMLVGGRKGEVVPITNKRGIERGLVASNQDMSIEDMVREERRTRGAPSGEARRLASSIAKDSAFADNLDYMDENASKLAARVEASSLNLRSAAISDFAKTNRILDACPLCHHEDTGRAPVAPIVSLATRTYLTLPTLPTISTYGGAVIVPIQHHTNLLAADEDTWAELRNFQKSLVRHYAALNLSVLFYENAAAPHTHQHAAMHVVALPPHLVEQAPAFFKEAILARTGDWSQHRPLIKTSGKGGSGLRKAVAREMPYFHVWYGLDEGVAHVVDEAGWPRGDGFAREVLGGMCVREPDVVRARGRWGPGDQKRVAQFREDWEQWDWTKVLLDAEGG